MKINKKSYKMYGKERLDAAYNTVSLFADHTWMVNDSDGFVCANQELWLRECWLGNLYGRIGMPRSVLDTIPQSRLAKYGSYLYDEARENTYIGLNHYADYQDTSQIFHHHIGEECWMDPSVEKIFQVLTDVNSKTHEIEEQCMEMLRNHIFDLQTEDNGSDKSTIEDNYITDDTLSTGSLFESGSEFEYPNWHTPPQGTINDFNELVLNMQLHSNEIRSLWPETVPLPIPDIYANISNVYNMVRIFCNADSMVLSFKDLDIMVDSIPAQSKIFEAPDPPPNSPLEPSTNVSPTTTIKGPTRRLYSDVLQNVASAAVQDELDDLEQQAADQYHDSFIAAAHDRIAVKFQELEQLAMEQYNKGQSSTENQSVVGMENIDTSPPLECSNVNVATGNGTCPLHKPPCGGKPTPYAALLLANSVFVSFYRSASATTRLLSYFQRFR